jgi:hypothetical protein
VANPRAGAGRGISRPYDEILRGRPKGSVNKATVPLREFILKLPDLYDRATVRQVFYLAEVEGLVAKTESGYRKVQRQVLAMRREDLLPWSFIADGTRWQRKPESFNSAADYLQSFVRGYRRDLWQKHGMRIEIWLEKDALADVIVDVTAEWDVSLMVSRGQSSATFLYNAAQVAAEAWCADGTETFIYTLYDHDAAGLIASETIARDLPEHEPTVPIHFERLAVTPQQIKDWNLPTRPAKDSRRGWGNKPAVELDAIPPDRLTQLVEDAITRHVDKRQWEIEQKIEAEEKAGLLSLVEGFNPPKAA